MKKNNKGFVVSAIMYPLLILFLAILMGLLSMSDTRKRILNQMKLEIADSIFNDSECSCDTILNKLNYIIKHGTGSGNQTTDVQLNIKNYAQYINLPTTGNLKNDIGIISSIDVQTYYISEIEPSNVLEGTIWIHLKQTSPNYIENSTSKLPIAYIEQYQGGKWVYVRSAVFDGDAWQELLYKEVETASAATINKGKTAVVNGKRVTGTSDPTGSYFTLTATSNLQTIKLRNRYITLTEEDTTYMLNGNEETYETHYINWENDSGRNKKIAYCTQGKSKDTTDDEWNNGTWTNYECESETVFQVSPTVVAIVYKYTTTNKTINSTVDDEVSKEQYYLKTYKADSTNIKNVSTVKLNPNYYTNRTRSYTRDTTSTYYEIDQFYSFSYNYQTFYNTLGDDYIYLYANEQQNYDKWYTDFYTTTESVIISPIRITRSNGKAAFYTDSDTAARQIKGSVTYDNYKNIYTGVTKFYETGQGMATVTFDNKNHKYETKTVFKSIVGLEVPSWTSKMSSDKYFGYSFRNYGEGYGYVGTYARYYWDYDYTYTNGILKINNLSTSLNSASFIDANSIHYETNDATATKVDLNKLVPTGLKYKQTECSYFKPTSSLYCTIHYDKGKAYVILAMNETQEMTLKFIPTSVSFRAQEDGIKTATINDYSYSPSQTLVLETYR